MYQHAKNQFIYSICSFSDTVNFRVPLPDWPHQFLAMFTHKIFNVHPKNFKSSFNLCEIVPACKKLVQSVLSWDTVKFRFQRPDWPHSFFTIPHQKLFNQLLIFVNLYQHAKNEAASLICSGEMLDLKILLSEWLRGFRPISHKDFFQIKDLCRKTTNNINFHYRKH